MFPRAAYRLSVDRDLCTGCGFCASIAPDVMGIDSRGKAYAKTEIVDWCSADGDFVRHCPTEAITASRLTVTSDQPIATLDDPLGSSDLAFSHDGRLLAASSSNGTIDAWGVP